MRTVHYYRASTKRQQASGLGLEAQREAVRRFCQTRDCEPVAEFTEVESGKRDDRPELAKALHLARVSGATLVISRLDRLSRNVAFLATLQDAGVRFLAADMPEASELTVHILAAVAQGERKAIATRTREALRAAKARGQRLGNPNGARALRAACKGNTAAISKISRNADAHARDVYPIIEQVRVEGVTSLSGIAQALNQRGIMTARGGVWHATTIKNLLARAARGTS